MTAVVDANVAVAVLRPSDAFHHVALHNCLTTDHLAILNLTRAEALIYPTRSGQLAEANDLLDDLGLVTEVLSNEVADYARELRAKYGNRHFPMLDAIVVAYGLLHKCPIITCDAKWPTIDDADIVVLSPS